MADAGEIKNINTKLIRRMFKQNKTLSKNTLSRETGLSFSTINRLVDRLVEAGELVEMGAGNSTGGRCAQLYALNPMFQVTLSLRLEAAELKWFVTDLTGYCLESKTESCESGVLKTIEELIRSVQIRYPQLGAIAMGVAGTVNHGIVTEPFGYEELRGVDLSAYIRQISSLPTAIEGDMFVASMGYCAGCREVPKAAVCIYIGQLGIGGGLVIGGNVWRGASEFAGELHYLPIEKNFEYVETKFDGADMVAYYGKIIRSYAALVNPDRVVLYENEFIAGKADAIRREFSFCLPPQAIPQLEVSRNFDGDYQLGLASIASDLLELG